MTTTTKSPDLNEAVPTALGGWVRRVRNGGLMNRQIAESHSKNVHRDYAQYRWAHGPGESDRPVLVRHTDRQFRDSVDRYAAFAGFTLSETLVLVFAGTPEKDLVRYAVTGALPAGHEWEALTLFAGLAEHPMPVLP